MDLSQPSPLFLGESLESLTLHLKGNAEHASAINDAIVTISQSPALEKLDLSLPSFFPAVSFAPLAVAPRLRVFRCWAVDCGQPTHPQIDELRMLPNDMHRLDLPNLGRDSLLYLLRSPHSLRWQEIHAVRDIDDEVSAALSTLPTLTLLRTYWECRSVSFLPALKQLRSLQLTMGSAVRLAADLAAALSRCSQLTQLALCAQDVTSQHLSQALLHLPQLRELRLVECSALTSLSFLSQCIHLSHSLQLLLLSGSDAPAHPDEIRHVLTLKSLTLLNIDQFFVEPLAPLLVQQLTPPSLLLPKLEQFRFTR